MKYTDRIYGNFEISEPVILELINAPSVQRLKGIDQLGYFDPFFKDVKYSRFEHSVGVYLLLKKFGASIEEQIAGLIHDISHSVFSHCIDYALDAGSQKNHSHQDNIFDDFVKKSEIPAILSKYGYDLDYILDDKNFLLKENNLPNLCADRIDYTFRNMVVFDKTDNIKLYVDNLVTKDNNWVFKDFEVAVNFAEVFSNLNKNFYLSLPAAIMMCSVGECLRYSLENSYISDFDLYTTDVLVLKKIKTHLKNNPKLSELFNRMNNKVEYKDDPDDYEYKIHCKSRIVDPLYINDGKIIHVSDTVHGWSQMVKSDSVPAEFFIKFI